MTVAALLLANVAVALGVAAQEASELRPDQMAELSVVQLSTVTPSPRPGDMVRLQVTVRNSALQPAARVPLVLFAGPQRVATTQVNLGPGETQTIPLNWKPTSSGTYTLTARVDPDATIPEVDRSDNAAQFVVAVAPEPASAGVSVSHIDVVPDTSVGGTIARIRVTNSGSRKAVAPLRIHVDGQPDDVRLVEVGPGQSALVDAPLPKSASRVSAEINSATPPNDRRSVSNVAVRDLRPLVDVRVDQLSVATTRFSPDRPRQVTLSFRVTNSGSQAIPRPVEVTIFPGAVRPGPPAALAPDTMLVPPLAAGESAYLSRTIISPVGEFDVRIEADPRGSIAGDDRSNNVATWHFKNPDSDVDRWVSIGPSLIKPGIGAVGELTSIAMQRTAPDTIYVGSKSAGIWKTSDGGATWAPVGDSLPTLRIGGIAMTPTNPSRIFVATADFGIFRSDDGGGTWQALPNSPNGESRFGVLIVSPRDPNLVYLGTSDGVHRSTDGGASWSRVLAKGQATDLLMAQATPTTLFAGVSGDGVYKSTDAGANWTRSSNGIPAVGPGMQVTLASSRNNAGTLYAGISIRGGIQIFRTNDAAGTWTQVNSPNDTGLFNDVIGADPDDPNIVYVTGQRLWRSTDGGMNYSHLDDGHVDYHALLNDPVASQTVYVLNDGGIYKSTARGQNWSTIGAGITNVEFRDEGLAATDQTVTIGGTQDNGTVKTTGSLTWNEILGGDGSTVEIDPTDSKIIYAMNQGQDSIQRADDGTSFKLLVKGLPTGDDLAGMNLAGACNDLKFHLHPRTRTTLLAPCLGLWRTTTTNPPGDWQQILPRPAPGSIVRSAIDPSTDIYYAGTSDGRIFAGTGGANWQVVFTHPSAASVADLDVDPANPRRLFVSFATGGPNSVFLLTRTSSSPVTLVGQAIGAGIPTGVSVNTLAVDRSLDFTAYAGTNKGVFRGRSSGPAAPWAWSLYSVGMPLADVRDLEVHPVTGVLRAATFGRSAFEVNTVAPVGSLLGAAGRIKFIRVHDVGTGFGPPNDFLDVEAIIMLDSMPGTSFGLQLREDASAAAHQGMFSLLRKAFAANHQVQIDYLRTGLRSGRIIRVMLLAP